MTVKRSFQSRAAWPAILLTAVLLSSAPALADGVFQDRFEDTLLPSLQGVDLSGNGQADIVNQSGSLLPSLQWIRDFPLSISLLGTADQFTASIGTVDGTTWNFQADSSGPYTLTALRDGEEDSAAGMLELRTARVISLGAEPVVDNEVEVTVACGTGSKLFGDNLAGLLPVISMTYAASDLPSGLNLTPEGQLNYNLSCDLGSPKQLSFAVTPTISAQDNQQELDALQVGITIEGVNQPQPPALHGIVEPAIANIDGELTPDLQWVKDFPLTVIIDGDADAFSASPGTVSGNEWTFESDTSGPYTLTAQRDGLEDSATGLLDLRTARVTELGDAPVQASGSEWIVQKELPCGEEYSGAFATNTGDLVPEITASYEAATTLPVGSSLTAEGVFTFTPSCSAGSPENAIFAVDSQIESQGNSLVLEQVLVDIEITGVDPGGPPPFSIFGLGFDNEFIVTETPHHGSWADSNDDGVIDQPVLVREDRLLPLGAYVIATNGMGLSLTPRSSVPAWVTLDDNYIAFQPPMGTDGQSGVLELLACDLDEPSACRDFDVPYEVRHWRPVVAGLSYSEQNGSIDNPNLGLIFEDDIVADCQESPHQVWVVSEIYDPFPFYEISNPAPGQGISGMTGSILSNFSCLQAGQSYFPSVRVSASSGTSDWAIAKYFVE